MNDLNLDPTRASADRLPLDPCCAPLKIALAEDNSALRRLLTLILLRDGHDVVESRDGGELLDHLAASYDGESAEPFDLVICEHALPGIAGLSLLSGMRSRQIRTSFILITGVESIQVRARRLGAVVLDHPFTLAGIRRAVRQARETPLAANDATL